MHQGAGAVQWGLDKAQSGPEQLSQEDEGALRISKQMSKKDFMFMKRMFDDNDRNGDGEIPREEVKSRGVRVRVRHRGTQSGPVYSDPNVSKLVADPDPDQFQFVFAVMNGWSSIKNIRRNKVPMAYIGDRIFDTIDKVPIPILNIIQVPNPVPFPVLVPIPVPS